MAGGWYLDELEVVTGIPVFHNPESFEAGWGDWVATGGAWEVGPPTSGPDGAHGGTNAVATVLGGNYADALGAVNGTYSSLVSPWFRVPSMATSPKLRFWQWFSFNSGDSGTVSIRAGTNAWTVLQTVTGNGGAWSQPGLDLSSYAGEPVQLAFSLTTYNVRHDCCENNQETGYGWCIDEIRIQNDTLDRIGDRTVLEGALLTFPITVSDERVTPELRPGAPDGASIDPALRIFTWLPGECQGPSTNLITITVTDPNNPTLQPLDYETITVIVEEVNEPPVIGSITPIPIQANVPVPLDVSEYVYDPDCPAQTLTYSLDGCSPTNAAIDAVTGQLSWTPTPEQAVQANTLCLRVTDGAGLSATATVLAGPPPSELRLAVRRPDGAFLEFLLEGATSGRSYVIESTSELKSPPLDTLWTEVLTNQWSGTAVRFERKQGREFFRLRMAE